jgi:hypothetical protein
VALRLRGFAFEGSDEESGVGGSVVGDEESDTAGARGGPGALGKDDGDADGSAFGTCVRHSAGGADGGAGDGADAEVFEVYGVAIGVAVGEGSEDAEGTGASVG